MSNGGLPGSLWETYSSFANTYGGCIICGVVEKKDGSWKTTGLRNLPKLKKDFWDTIHNSKKVSKCLITENDTEEYTYQGDVIFVIKVLLTPKFVSALTASFVSVLPNFVSLRNGYTNSIY